jgi:hypothetical protein
MIKELLELRCGKHNTSEYVRFQALTAASMKIRVSWYIALMIEALRTSETSVYSNKPTRRYIPESSNIQIKIWSQCMWVLCSMTPCTSNSKNVRRKNATEL